MAASMTARIGQAAVWVALAGLLAVLVVGATVDTADAAQSSQNIFVGGCKSLGGTSKRIRAHVVRCTFPKKEDGSGGGVVTCDFNQRPFKCKYQLGPHAGATDVPFGEIDDMIGSVVEPESNPRGPAIPPVDDIATTKEAR